MPLEHITMLHTHVSVDGSSTLYAGTASKLFRSTPGESWILLGDGFGGEWSCPLPAGTPDYALMPPIRWTAAFVGDIGLFANGTDNLQSYSQVDEPYATGAVDKTSSSAYALLQPVDDLIALDITAPKVVRSYKGFAFIAGPVVAGTRQESQIYWSDFNDPRGWLPGSNTLAGYVDLGGGETVLAMEPLGGRLKVYTDQAIYNAYYVGGAEVWRFEEVYRGQDTLYFPNSLVNTGKEHLYLGKDSIMVATEFDRAPRLLEWLKDLSGAVYNGVPSHYVEGLPLDGGDNTILEPFCPINTDACFAACGGYDGRERLVWFSWPTADDEGRTVPNMSLAIHSDTKTSCVVDNGFTAFVSSSNRKGESLSQWLNSVCICEPMLMVNEGNSVAFDSDCDSIPPKYNGADIVCLVHPKEFDDDFIKTVSDSEIPSADSWCAWADANGKNCIDCAECVTPHVFVMADALDLCLKEYDPDYYARDFMVSQTICGWCNVPETGSFTVPEALMECPPGAEPELMMAHPNGLAIYRRDNYATLWQTDPSANKTPVDNTLHAFRVTYDRRVHDCYPVDDGPPESQTDEYLHGQAGAAHSPGCVVWEDDDPQILDCPDGEPLKSYEREDHRITFRYTSTGEFVAVRIFAGSNRADGEWIGKLSLNDMTLDISGACKWYWG